MKVALRELRRRPARFVTATLILTLVAVLVMFLGGLLDGLIRGSTGALRAQDADVIVYSDTARSTFARSRIEADTRGDRRGRARRRAHRRDRSRAARGAGARQRPTRAGGNGLVRVRAGALRRSRATSPRARCTPMTYCAPTASRSGWRSCSALPDHRSP